MTLRIALGEALSELIDHRGKTPKKLGGDWTTSGHRVISALNIKDHRVDENDHHYVSAELYAKWMKTPLRRGDVLLTSEAPLGEVAYLDRDVDWCLGQRLFALRPKPDVLDGRYLSYLLRGGQARNSILSRSTGSTVSGIRQAELVKVELRLPTVEEQRDIADTLGALDDKIESNRRVIGLIGEIVAARYQRWRANVAITRVTTFGEFADVYGGATPKTGVPEYWGGALSWATPTDVTRLSAPYLLETSRTITEAGLKSCAATLHPPGTIFMTSRATIGAFAVNSVPAATNQGFIAVRPKHEADRWFLLEEMRTRVEEFVSNANGSTFLELSRGRFKALPVAVPGMGAVAELHHQLDPLHKKAAQTVNETERLAALRDTLLPALLSGQVSVSAAEAATL